MAKVSIKRIIKQNPKDSKVPTRRGIENSEKWKSGRGRRRFGRTIVNQAGKDIHAERDGNQFLTVTFKSALLVKESDETILEMIGLLTDVYSLHPKATDIFVSPNDSLEHVLQMLYTKVTALLPKYYEIGFYRFEPHEFEDSQDDVSLHLCFYRQFEEYNSHIYADAGLLPLIKKHSRQLYEVTRSVFKNVLQRGGGFYWIDVEDHHLEYLDQMTQDEIENEPKRRKEILAEMSRKVGLYASYEQQRAKLIKRVNAAPFSLEKALNISTKRGKALSKKGSKAGKVYRAVENLIKAKQRESVREYTDVEVFTNYSDEVHPGYLLTIGFDHKSLTEDNFYDDLNMRAQEGVQSPCHIIECSKNSNPWKGKQFRNGKIYAAIIAFVKAIRVFELPEEKEENQNGQTD